MSGKRQTDMPRVLDTRPKTWAPRKPARPANDNSPFAKANAKAEARAARRKAARLADKANAKTHRATAEADAARFSSDQIRELWEQGEFNLLQPTLKRIVREMVDRLINFGQASHKFKGKVLTIRAPYALKRSDADSLFTIGYMVARDAAKKFDGRGALVGYVSTQVWYAFGHEFDDAQGDHTAGIADLPAELKGRRPESLQAPARDPRGTNPHAYESGTQAATRLDQLPVGASPWSEADEDMMRRVYEGTDPAKQGTEFGMDRAALNEILTAAIAKVRAHELRAILQFLLEHGYDFSRRTAYLLKRYAVENGLTLLTVRLRRVNALAAMREHLTAHWPDWREHFHTGPRTGKWRDS